MVSESSAMSGKTFTESLALTWMVRCTAWVEPACTSLARAGEGVLANVVMPIVATSASPASAAPKAALP